MKRNNGRTRTWLALPLVALMMSGCLDLGGDPAEAPDSLLPPSGSNSAPVISGNPPPAIKIGDIYSFTPSASDPDGDVLTFQIQNIPTWATFNAATGTLSGQPFLGDIGNYDNISISASDGNMSATLRSFNIDVTELGLGSATLTWTPPTTNTDGTPMVDLAGYKLYYGPAPGNYTNEITITNPGISTFVVDNLSPRTYYFAAKAVSNGGVESDFSNVAMKIVD